MMMDNNNNTLTLVSTDDRGRKFQFNVNDQTWSTKVLNQTFEGKSTKDLIEQIEAARKQREELATTSSEHSEPEEEADEESKKIDTQAGYRLTFIQDKDTQETQVRVVLYEQDPYKSWSGRKTIRLVDEDGRPGERITTYDSISANRRFSKPRIKAIAQGIADHKYYDDVRKEVPNWNQQIIEKCGGTLTVRHECDDRRSDGLLHRSTDNARHSDPQWPMFPYEPVDLSPWKQSGEKITHKNGTSIKAVTSSYNNPKFIVNLPKSLVKRNNDWIGFDDVYEAMVFAQTLAVMIEKAPTINGHKAAHMHLERDLYQEKQDGTLFEFTVLGIVGTDAAAMLVREEDGGLALLNVPRSTLSKNILTKHLDEVNKPIQAIYDVISEARGRLGKAPGLRPDFDGRGMVDKQDTQALEDQFRKLKSVAEEFNTQIKEANKQNEIDLEKRRIQIKSVIDQIGAVAAKPRAPKA